MEITFENPDQLLNTMPDGIKVCFQLGNVCTNNCSYCPAGCKDGSHPWPKLSDAKNILKKIKDVYTAEPYNKKTIFVEYLGGEVTVWKEFEQLLDYADNLGIRSRLVTNGVRTVRWWKANASRFHSITYSFHPEHDTYEHCLEVVNALSESGVCVNVLVLMLPSKWEFCKSVVENLIDNSKCRGITARTITNIDDTGTGNHGRYFYTDEQIDFCRDNSMTLPTHQLDIAVEDMYLYFVNTQTKQKFDVSPEALINLHKNKFEKWACNVGIDTLYLEQNGDIRRDAMCYIAKPIGNWKYDNLDELTWPTNPVLCTRKSCFCTHDLYAKKVKFK